MSNRNPYQMKTIACLVATMGVFPGGVLAETVETSTVEVVSTTPLPGIGLPIEQVPASVQVVKGAEMQNQQSLTVADYMSQNMVGVNVNETQNNPFQPNVNFRGFTASPLLGTPQGLSVYQDGVRVNEPFGDVVSWDLIPLNAISSMSMMPGSNPLFGLNTLGGAISIQTKRGRTVQGGAIEASAGSWGRKNGQFEFGGIAGNGVDYFIAGNYFDEDGWRDSSPSEVKQLFGQLGWQNDTTDISLTMSLADNDLIGNGLLPKDMLDALDREAIFTKPDQTKNQMAFFNLNGSHWLSEKTMLSGNLFYRNVKTKTLNGDLNDDFDDDAFDNGDFTLTDLCQDVDPDGIPGNGDELEADETCSGALNRSRTKKIGYGFNLQATFDHDLAGHKNQLVTGLGYDYSRIKFEQNTQYGLLNASRGVDGVDVFSSPDEAVDLKGTNRTWSVFATDAFSFTDQWHLTLSGRYNHSKVDNSDQLDGTGVYADEANESLSGEHSFNRFNPAIGLNFTPSQTLTAYGAYNEGNRAPTSMELGCANPDQPCKLPNAMAGDPPLKQVVAKTIEAGLRGKITSSIGYTASIYRTRNIDDIQFIAAGALNNGSGYFDNVGETLRKGIDLGVNGEVGSFRWFAGYSYVRATYESRFSIAREQEINSSAVNGGCGDVDPAVEAICVNKGDRIPGIPQHQFKLRGEWQALPQWVIGTNIVAFSDQYSHGNENNAHSGTGAKVAGYTVLNLDTRYKFGNSGWQAFAKVNNVFDRDYYTGGMLGGSMLDATGNFTGVEEAQPFYAVGAPRAGWIGLRYEFGGAKNSARIDND